MLQCIICPVFLKSPLACPLLSEALSARFPSKSLALSTSRVRVDLPFP